MIINALASVAVNDLAKSKSWYQGVLGRAADSTPMPELAEWHFEQGGALQVYELGQRAGAGSVTLAVSSLDDQINALRKVGINPGEPMLSKQFKVIMIKDPDGNSIAFAETLGPASAH